MQRAPKAYYQRALSLYFHRETDRVKGTYGHDTVNRRVKHRLAIGGHRYRYRSCALNGKSMATPADSILIARVSPIDDVHTLLARLLACAFKLADRDVPINERGRFNRLHGRNVEAVAR